MTKFFKLVIVALVINSCNQKNTDATSSNALSQDNGSSNNAAVEPAQPCSLFTTQDLASTFNIVDTSLIEMYDREKFWANTNQCQYLWQEENGSVIGSQVMIDISHKIPDLGATFSRMQELKIKDGLTSRENGQTIVIKPTPIEGLGEHAFHWEHIDFQNVQIICFQVRNEYQVEITYNAHKGINTPKEEIKKKLITIANQIKSNL